MKSETYPEILTQEQTEVIQELVNCALACEACSSSCLREKDVAHMTRCIELTRDCAEICFQAARHVMRRSEIARQFLTVCEEICRVCADECRKHNEDHCEICAEACESCADNCNRFYKGSQ
jgi:hypothetical protein